jgi:nucleoside-diphosphate-sugar epimerase
MPAQAHRFRQPTLLIIGCGDVGLRVARLLRGRWRLLALSSSPARLPLLREAGITPLLGNLDDASSLGRLAPLADAVLHLAPPPAEGTGDPRSLALVRALMRSGRVRRLVYASTSGVYGDCGGAWVSETRACAPATPRGKRRVAAESLVRWFGRASGAAVSVLRIPGIYANDRVGGTPRERLLAGTPVLRYEDDVFTNHIHADDLARACVAALHRGAAQRVVNVSDDATLRMAQYYDLAADLYGFARPPRVSRDQARQQLSPMALSFMGESRRLKNDRLKTELRLKLRYPTPREGLAAGLA